MMPVTQVTVILTPKQHAKIVKRLREKKKDNVFVRKADIVREIVDAGLEALDKK